MNLIVKAPAKLNLCLRITGRRQDGYHNLQTMFQLVDLCDQLEFKPTPELQLEGISPLEAEDNLVIKAARLLQRQTGCRLGASIRLTKRIPMGAGMGGGSSDAAATLHGLNWLWDLGLSRDQLAQMGLELGADVPVFVYGRSAWAEGVGEQLEYVDLPENWYLILRPNCHISTAEIFTHPDLTRDSRAITIARFLDEGSNNDCEPVARKLYPEVDEALNWLSNWGAAKMTGTGSCVFLALDSEEKAVELQGLVPEKWTSFVARGINLSPTLSALADDEVTL